MRETINRRWVRRLLGLAEDPHGQHNHSEGDNDGMDDCGRDSLDLDVSGRGYFNQYLPVDCSPKTSITLFGVGYDSGRQGEEFEATK